MLMHKRVKLVSVPLSGIMHCFYEAIMLIYSINDLELIDTDECKGDESICKDGTYCLNTPGDYRCQGELIQA